MITPEDIDNLMRFLGFEKVLDMGVEAMPSVANNCVENCVTLGGSASEVSASLDILSVDFNTEAIVLIDYTFAFGASDFVNCVVSYDISVDAVSDTAQINLFKLQFTGSCLAPV
ncbi:hypothetical protein ATG_13110 [Desulfurococcaceae archaeon AG1]|nr:hypothetical protein ATG_13110 [Desulfurococcaceae archaeon AG1]